MKLLIVESPNKVSTLQHILGKGWMVAATVGHLTELANDGDGNLGFEISSTDVKCRYVPRGDRGAGVIKKLKDLINQADQIYLATDPDREGEGIGWHVAQLIGKRKPYKRVTYTQITETAVKQAIAQSRDLDMHLVHAQQSRQVVDKLVGYKLSSRAQTAGVGASAGRVQSAALHILCERERQIQSFKSTPYWSVQSEYGEGFRAVYLGKEAAQSKELEEGAVDESADPGESKQSESKRITTEAEAKQLVAIAQASPHQVIESTGKQTLRSPPPALTTSSLQQAAGVQLGMSSDEVMKIAQELFEGMKLPDGSVHGAITYHRTDSVDLAPEFVESVMGWLKQHEPKLVPNKAVQHKDKAGSQGAHEAIRPVDVANTPERMKPYLSEPQLKIYTLIWQRAIASQCAPAQLQKSRVVIQAGSTFWEARGSILTEPGYTKIWNNLGKDAVLPSVKQGQSLTLKRVWSEAKQTKPPGRYSEPQLIKTLEQLGIGRPSTYATIMSTIKTRGYASVEKKVLVPTPLGLGLDTFLIKISPFIVDVKFTAGMEKALDAIAQGKQEWKGYLCGFNQFFLGEMSKSDAILSQFRKRSDQTCPTCSKPLSVMPYRKKPANSSKDHYLKCLDGCTDVVLFWNETAKGWKVKGEKKETPPGKLTEFVCQVCGKSLEEFSYVKEGQPKTMLRCSDSAARQKPNHSKELYFTSSKGGYWNPNSKQTPSTSKVSTPAGSRSTSGAKSTQPSTKKRKS